MENEKSLISLEKRATICFLFVLTSMGLLPQTASAQFMRPKPIVIPKVQPVETKVAVIKPDVTIQINNRTIIKPVNTDIFGISIAKVARNQWLTPIDLNSSELKQLFYDLKPPVITLDNNQLGMPFLEGSVGPKDKRLGIVDTLRRIDVSKDSVGAALLARASSESIYFEPPHNNYDDILGFLETLPDKPKVILRIPMIFTDQNPDYFEMKFSLDSSTGSNLVSYLNDNKNTYWGSLRAKSGHPLPYNIKTFVLDNELWSYNQWVNLPLEQITSQYDAFANSMKKADPDIKVGLNLVDRSFPLEYLRPGVEQVYSKMINYNNDVLNAISAPVDFVTFHVYSGMGQEGDFLDLTDQQWKFVMAQNYMKKKYDSFAEHSKLPTPKGDSVQKSISEYTGPLLSLGGALYNAEYIMYMLKADYSYATGWNLGIMEPGGNFGLLKVTADKKGDTFVKRPAYYALRMFTNGFTGNIVETKITCDTFSTEAINTKYYSWPSQSGIPQICAIAATDMEKTTLIVVNRNCEKDLTVAINLAQIEPESTVMTEQLAGSKITATNEDNPSNVTIESSEKPVGDLPFNTTVKKHSITKFTFIKPPAE